MPRMCGISGPGKIGYFCHSFLIRVIATIWIPLSLQKCKWILHFLMSLGHTVHWSKLKPYAPVGLLCHTTESTLSSKPCYASPSSSWKQDSSNTDHNVACNMLQKWTRTSLHRDSSMIRHCILPGKLTAGEESKKLPGKIPTGKHFFLQFPHLCI